MKIRSLFAILCAAKVRLHDFQECLVELLIIKRYW